ncbi:MAG: cytochrome P450, partial [Burkholderiales bacterium]
LSLLGFPKRVFCFRKPEHIMQILTHKSIGGIKFLPMMPRVKWLMRGGAYVLQGGEDWSMRRRIVQPAFSVEAAAHQLGPIVDIVESRIANWPTRADSAQTIDIYREMRELIVDLSFKIFFSSDMGDRVSEIAERTLYLEKCFVKVSPLWLPLPGNAEFKRETELLRDTMAAIIEERKRAKGSQRDLITLLLEGDKNGGGLSDDDIIDELMSIYFGISVIAITLTWGLSLIATQPEVKAKLRAEAQAFLSGGRETRVRRGLGLSYTTMVFNEITRLYPPSWGFPRHALEQVVIDGQNIPADSIVIPMIYHVQRDAKIWPNPLHFDPERFAPERANGIHLFAHFPFGGGQRKCTGANIAPTIAQLVLLTILARYDLESAPRFPGDPVAEFGFEICPKDKVMMRLHQLSS